MLIFAAEAEHLAREGPLTEGHRAAIAKRDQVLASARPLDMVAPRDELANRVVVI